MVCVRRASSNLKKVKQLSVKNLENFQFSVRCVNGLLIYYRSAPHYTYLKSKGGSVLFINLVRIAYKEFISLINTMVGSLRLRDICTV
jgi:hypothetical protein